MKKLIFKEFGQDFPANSTYVKITGANNFAPWDEDGNLKEGWKRKIIDIVGHCKKNGLFFLPIFYSALWFRHQASGKRKTGLENTFWNIGGNIDDSREFFYQSEMAHKLQIKAILFVLNECRRAGINHSVSLGWESHTQGDNYVIPWFRKLKKAIHEEFTGVRVGINSYKKTQVLKGGADFMVTEGGSCAASRGRKGGMGDREFPHYILNSNPGRLWSPHNPGKYGEYTMVKVYKDFAKWAIKNIQACGSTGVPFDRWVDKKTMQGDLKNNEVDISRYDFEKMKKALVHLYQSLLNCSLNRGEIAVIMSPPAMIIEPEEIAVPEPGPLPEPEKKEEYKDTAPLEIVEPEKKEDKMSWYQRAWKWLRKNWNWLSYVVVWLAGFVLGLIF